MSKSYYPTKTGPDDWIVSGRRHHLQIVRTEGPSGRSDRRGEDVLQKVFLVSDRANVVNLDDQYDVEPHGFTRLKDAVSYAVDKLTEYDNKVDPRKTSKNPADYKLADVLEAWDELWSFTHWASQEFRDRLTRSYEILEQGITFDDWLENRVSNVVSEYAELRGLSIDAAAEELKQRPVKKPTFGAQADERKKYTVHVTWKHPAWDEKDGADLEIEARSKAEACKYARNEMRRRGHLGAMYFSATEGAAENPREPAKLRHTVKTVPGGLHGLNVWTFRVHPNFELTVRERADGLYEAEGPGFAVGQKLSEAVLELRDRLPKDTGSWQAKWADHLTRIAKYFSVEIGS